MIRQTAGRVSTIGTSHFAPATPPKVWNSSGSVGASATTAITASVAGNTSATACITPAAGGEGPARVIRSRARRREMP